MGTSCAVVDNTFIIERRNNTARRMSAYQVRKSLAFSRRPDTKVALGWWGVTVSNWRRPHRLLRLPLAEPQGKKLPRTSAMTLGLADHILSSREVLLIQVFSPRGWR